MAALPGLTHGVNPSPNITEIVGVYTVYNIWLSVF